jgi:alpha-glucosidase (family GH31 glycosyl hydrolase)
MYLHWPEHDDAYRHDRQYMLGPSVLVAPVGAPGDPARKTVWFPPGVWVDFFTGERHRGPGVEELVVPLERMPVFVRAGAVLPMQGYRPHESDGPADPLVVSAWAGRDGSFRLYEDGGDGLEYRRGSYSFTRIAHDDRGRTSVITIGRARGRFPGRLARRRWEVRLVGVGRPRGVTVNGRRARSSYEPASRTVVVRTRRLATSRPVRVAISE